MFQVPTQMMQMMQQIMSDPIGIGKEKGFDVPVNLANDPQAMVMHLINSGQVSQPMMQRIAPMLKMMGK